MQTTLTRIFIVLESVSHGLPENSDEISRKFEGFFRPKSDGLQKKKKKRSSPKLRLIFRPNSEIQTFEGGLFSIFHKKSASKALKTCDFAYFTSQWGGLEPPRPPPPHPPSYATALVNVILPTFFASPRYFLHFGKFSADTRNFALVYACHNQFNLQFWRMVN